MMSKNGKGCVCPVSLGLAVGLTSALFFLVCFGWMMNGGSSMMMSMMHMSMPTTWSVGVTHAFWAFVRGFFFGFFVALFYDYIVCRCGKFGCSSKK
jgi:hypothetical protein